MQQEIKVLKLKELELRVNVHKLEMLAKNIETNNILHQESIQRMIKNHQRQITYVNEQILLLLNDIMGVK